MWLIQRMAVAMFTRIRTSLSVVKQASPSVVIDGLAKPCEGWVREMIAQRGSFAL